MNVDHDEARAAFLRAHGSVVVKPARGEQGRGVSVGITGAAELDAALAEIDTLPEPVRTAMADWIAQARSRAQADAALAELRNALSAPDASPAN